MLFPEANPIYLDEKSRDVKQRMEAFYAESISINQSFWSEGEIDTRFWAGDQTLWNDMGYGNLPATRRRQFNFNRIRRIVNQISGQQRRSRRSMIASPEKSTSTETADQLTDVLMWATARENILDTVSQAFEGALVTGLNLLQVWVDYRSDPVSGDIKVDNHAFNSWLIDPFFRKQDLSDCMGLLKRSYLTRREIISLLPNHKEELLDLPLQYTRDDKFQFMPETYGFGQKNLLTYDEFYYRTYRTQTMLCDTQNGKTLEWRSQDKERLKFYLQLHPMVTVYETEIPSVNLAIVVQGKVIEEVENPLGIDRYPFVPVLTYYAPQMSSFPWRIQGIVRGLRDSQYLFNRRKVIELDILESQVNSGIIMKENTLVNPKDAYTQTGQGKVFTLKDEAQITDFQVMQSPAIPPSNLAITEALGEDMNQTAGISGTQVGDEASDKSGYMMAVRQNTANVGQEGIFNSLDISLKLLGEICVDIIKYNFTPGKVEAIIGKKPTREFYDKDWEKYNIIIEEGLNTTSQKQMQFAQILQLHQVGFVLPKSVILDACTIQNKKEILKQIQQQEQQQAQAQQMQLQAALQEQEARTNLAHSRAVADQGLGLERLSRIKENKSMAVERQAAAVRDENEAVLNFVKAIKELDTIDFEHLEKMVAMQQMIKQQEQAVNKESEEKPQTQGAQ
jgi:hypothetical protein